MFILVYPCGNEPERPLTFFPRDGGRAERELEAAKPDFPGLRIKEISWEEASLLHDILVTEKD